MKQRSKTPHKKGRNEPWLKVLRNTGATLRFCNKNKILEGVVISFTRVGQNS